MPTTSPRLREVRLQQSNEGSVKCTYQFGRIGLPHLIRVSYFQGVILRAYVLEERSPASTLLPTARLDICRAYAHTTKFLVDSIRRLPHGCSDNSPTPKLDTLTSLRTQRLTSPDLPWFVRSVNWLLRLVHRRTRKQGGGPRGLRPW